MTHLNKLSIRGRIALVSCCMMLVAASFAWLGVLQLNRIAYNYHYSVRTIATRQQYIAGIISSMMQLRFTNLAYGYVVYHEELYDLVSHLQLASYDQGESIMWHLSDYRRSVAADPYLSESEKLARLVIADDFAYLFNSHYIPSIERLRQELGRPDRDAFIEAVTTTMTLGDELLDLAWLLRDRSYEFVFYVTETTAQQARNAQQLMIIFALGFMVLLGLLVLWMKNTVLIPISELKFAIGDYMDAIIFVTDMDYKFIYANKEYLDTFSVNGQDYIGKACYESRGYNSVCSNCLVGELTLEGVPTFKKYDFIWDEGVQKWFSGQVSLVKWPDDRMVFFHYLRDVTDEALRKGEHQKRKEELNASLKGAQLTSMLIANAGHEIRTPMSSILGYSELALDDNIPGATREHLKKIVRNVKSLTNVVNDVVDISTIEYGRFDLEHAPFDIHEVLNHCRSVISPQAIAKNLLLHFYAEPEADKLLIGDGARISQVCVNILSNAVKFTDYGAVKCSVVVKEVTYDNCTLEFEIRDSGIGMTKDQIDMIFEPLEHMELVSTKKYASSGLSLTMSKILIEAMGSKLEVESAPGIGSRFSFTLNFPTTTTEGSQDEKLNTSIDNHISKPHFENGEVLIVEDNEMNQGVVCEHLKRVGLSFIVANNGMEAIEIVRKRIQNEEKLFDLIFMDIYMPIMDGYEASSIINGWATGIPIVAMTANALSVAKGSYKELGMEDCITKPFTATELWAMLLKYFKPLDNVQVPVDDETTDNIEASEVLNPPYSNELNSDEVFFNKMLVHFIKNNKNIYNEISDAVDKHDMVLAHRLAHNLKSNAGHIKKSALQKVATKLEHAFKTSSDHAELLQTLKTELDSAITELMPLLREEEPAKPTLSLNQEDIMDLFDELEPLLASGNAAYLDYVERLKALNGSDKLIECMENFNSTIALEELSKLRAQIT